MIAARTAGRAASALAFGAALSWAAFGCGGTGMPAADASSSSRFPSWEARAKDVFDDNIDPAAVGLTMETSSRSDPFLRERAQTAELVARFRVSTVTVDTFGADVSYHLGIQVIPPPFIEPKLLESSFELYIRPTGRAYAIVKAFDARLRGSSFIGFIHRFAGEGGEPEIHWHLAPDSAEVAAAVKEALALAELSGS